eukprot:s2538_g30.t1
MIVIWTGGLKSDCSIDYTTFTVGGWDSGTPFPFPPEGGLAAPSTPSGPKSRSVYITVERIIKFKETPGCKGCTGHSKTYTDECRARFAKPVEEEKAVARRSAPAPSTPASSSKAPPAPEPGSFEEAMMAPEPAPERASSAALLANKRSLLELGKDHLPVFGSLQVQACPAEPSASQQLADQIKTGRGRNNRRQRRQEQKDKSPGVRSTLFEFCCAERSTLQQTCEYYGINYVGLAKERYNLLDYRVSSQLEYQLEQSPNADHL